MNIRFSKVLGAWIGEIGQNKGTDRKSFIVGNSIAEVITVGFMEVVR